MPSHSTKTVSYREKGSIQIGSFKGMDSNKRFLSRNRMKWSKEGKKR